MEAMDPKKKSKYIRGIALNGGLTLVIFLALFMFALPKYEEVGILVEKINAALAETEHLKTNGVDAGRFQELVREKWRTKELPDDVFSDKAKLNKVLKKPASFTGNYITWTSAEAGKIDAINAEVEENERILGNIIPNYVNSTAAESTPIKNQVNLQSFIKYVEKDILAKYALSSFAPIGIDSVTFDKDKTSSVNIGSFKITLDFTGKNSDIYDFIDAVQRSGKLTIRNGKLVPNEVRKASDTAVSDLSNLLITIDSLMLTSTLERDNRENGGTVVLKFYVEGMNYQKILFLRNSIITRFDALKKGIRENGELCSKGDNAICKDGVGNSSVAVIKNLWRSMAGLQPKIDTLKKTSTITDMNAELDNLFSLQSSIKSLELVYASNMATIKKIKERSTRK